MSEYPKVLIVGDSLTSSSGGGVTLRNLFGLWQKSDILDFHSINGVENGQWWKWRWQLHPKHHSNTPIADTAPNNSLNQMSSSRQSGLKEKCKKFIFSKITPYYSLRSAIVSDAMLDAITGFSPDVMYFQPSYGNLDLLCKLKFFFKVPYVIHFLDDWISHERNRNYLFSPWLGSYIDSKLRTIVGDASGCIAIGEDMASYYGKMFNRNFVFFHNPVSMDLWNINKLEDNVSVNTPFRCLYSGKIGDGVSSSLEMISQAVKQVCSSGLSGKFHITTRNTERATDLGLKINLSDWCSYKELPSFMSSHDILILPFDFDPHSVNLRWLSIPTKLSEYMATGVPILLFAPEELSITKLARRYGWAHVVSENNLDVLSREMQLLLTDNGLRYSISNRAVEFARNHFSLNTIRNEFLSYISGIVSENGEG